jgi:hypothetical protein
MMATPFKSIIDSSNLTLFFSLPFRPAGKKNFFFNGHIAVGLDNIVYQIYNPQLLKSEFLFSKMPLDLWLFGAGGKWVERDSQSPCFRHVYLYGKCESVRTVIYCAGATVKKAAISALETRFYKEDERFLSGQLSYNFFRNNCSTFIARALCEEKIVPHHPFNTIPVFFFKQFIRSFQGGPCALVGKVAKFDSAAFRLRRFCIGMKGLNPQKSMDRWISAFKPPKRGNNKNPSSQRQ